MSLTGLGNGLDGILKSDWKHGPCGCYGDCEDCGTQPCKTIVCGTAYQFGFTSKALGYNCLLCCCCYYCCPTCAVLHQRLQVKAKYGLSPNMLCDVFIACCFPGCAVYQQANQVGDDADYRKQKLSELLKPPSKADMEKMKNDTAESTKNMSG